MQVICWKFLTIIIKQQNQIFYIFLIIMQNVSFFAQNINFPICQFLDLFASKPANNQKPSVSFLSGDPTVYGLTKFKMPERGYQILKQNILNQNNHGYSESSGNPKFREAIKNLYKPKISINFKDVFINHGVNMGLFMCLQALSNQGEEVLVPQIGYPFYHDVCPALKRKTISYKLKPQQNFEIDLQDLATKISEKTSFIYIINPTNPTGTVFSLDHMKDILKFSDKYEVPLVVDQVYYKQVYPGVETTSFGELTEETPVIVLSGVEKLLSVPGWVQSWTVLFDKNNVFEQVRKNLQILATIFLHTNTFTQAAMPKILQQIGLFTTKQMQVIHKNYLYLTQQLKKIPGMKPLKAQGTIYLAVQINLQIFLGIQNDKQFVFKLKQQQNVCILPLSIFGTLQGLRLLTCGNETQYIPLLQRISSFAHKHLKP